MLFDSSRTFTEKMRVPSNKLLFTVQNLFHEGHVRHIVIKNLQGYTLVEFPVTAGVVGFLLAPMLSMVAGLAVYAADFRILVTRDLPSIPN